jgi:hypothetical protein
MSDSSRNRMAKKTGSLGAESVLLAHWFRTYLETSTVWFETTREVAFTEVAA